MKKLPKEAFIHDQLLIQSLKSSFQDKLSEKLGLIEVQAPILTVVGDGVQDDLNGIETPVSVSSSVIGKPMQIVHSLAKWKRQLLARTDFDAGQGIVTQMRALRPDEDDLTERHSISVDQWDWEKVISLEQRRESFLVETVKDIYQAMKDTDQFIAKQMSRELLLPDDITFIHSEDLLQQYPDLSAKQREYQACKEFGAVFLQGIGSTLSDGLPHDGRAPDYDDWTTQTSAGYKGLNGDILVWNPILEDAFELSSMGIRVSKEVMLEQLKERDCEHRLEQAWHQQLQQGQLPQTLGGGIGQSRLAMFLLQKPHIGQVQFSVWPEIQELTLL